MGDGDSSDDAEDSIRGWLAPQLWQNLSCAGFGWPQCVHRKCCELRASPHSPQNAAPSGFSWPQVAERTVVSWLTPDCLGCRLRCNGKAMTFMRSSLLFDSPYAFSRHNGLVGACRRSMFFCLRAVLPPNTQLILSAIENGWCGQTLSVRLDQRHTLDLREPHGTGQETPTVEKEAHHAHLEVGVSGALGWVLLSRLSSLLSWEDNTNRRGGGRAMNSGETVEYWWRIGGISRKRVVQNLYCVE